MELRHLRYFVAVQPSLTRQIKDLEEELGVRLLNRTKQQVTLTDEGRSFLADAKRLLSLAAETVESVRRLHSGEVRALNIGYVTNLFYDLLPRTLAPWRASRLFGVPRGEPGPAVISRIGSKRARPQGN
jgi:DNA-binding transcriptional LysR family regulator